MKINRRISYVFLSVMFMILALSGCKSKEVGIITVNITPENNIAYTYSLSTDLTRATGFSKDLAVLPADTPNSSDTSITAPAAILVDITDNEILYNKNIFTQMNPASTTKILTSIVTFENANLADVCTFTQEDITFHEDNVWICDYRVGDTITIEQALFGALVSSGNDAACVLASSVAGSIPAFANMMNERARVIGATNSLFANPHGLTDPNHYTTAYDLYLITNEAIKNPSFVKVSSTVEYKTSITRGKYQINHTYNNGNQLLNGTYTPPNGMKVIAGKTGYTQAAGYCLVLVSENPSSGHRFISVILHADNKKSLYNQMTYLLQEASKH